MFVGVSLRRVEPMDKTQVKTVAIYARESHGEDEDTSISVGDQVNRCEQWTADEGWEVVGVIKDVGSAARKTNRPRRRFGELRELIVSGKIDAVLANEGSRYARQMGELGTLADDCEVSGVLLGYGRRLYDMSDPDERMIVMMIGSVSEGESRRTGKRIGENAIANAKRGGPHGRQLYGYVREYEVNNAKGSRRVKAVHIDQEVAPVVKGVFTDVAAGKSYYSIAQQLNADGIPPQRPKGGPWTGEIIKAIVTNPAYVGDRVHRGKVIGDAMWDGIVDRKLWDQAQQQVMGRSRRRKPSDSKVAHLLSGIAVCGACGGPTISGKNYKGRPKDKDGNRLHREVYRVYVCKPGRTGGGHVAMREDYLDEMVSEIIIARLSRPDFLDQAGEVDDDAAERRRELSEQIDADRRYLDEVKTQAAEARDLSIFLDQRNLVQPKIDAAQREIEKLSGIDPSVRALASSEDVRASWEGMSLVDQKQLVRTLMTVVIKPVPVGKRGRPGPDPDRVEIVWN